MDVLSGWSIGARSPRAYFRRVNLCPNCARNRRRHNWFALPIAVAGIFGALVLIGSVSPGSSAKSIGDDLSSASAGPWALTPLPRCRPTPCMTAGGLRIEIARVRRDVDSGANGFHFVEATIRYTDVAGEQTIDPGTDFSLLDPAGVWQDPVDTSNSEAPASCQSFWTPETLGPTGHAGPYLVCFQAGGPATGPLLLMFGPQSLGNSCNPAVGQFAPGAMKGAKFAASGSMLTDRTDGCQAALIRL
jgi:hypothetical protein